MKLKYYSYYILLLLSFVFLMNACSEDEGYQVPDPKAKAGLQNDCIKRSAGPNLVGMPIEFAYAMALMPTDGKIVSAQVEASIPGAAGTMLDNNSYYTNGSGQDVGIPIAAPSTTEGVMTTITFNRDTSAATLRYFYVVPPEARGQSVKFTFSATDSNGKTVTYPMGPYNVSTMDFVLNKAVNNNTLAYISIEDMTAYNATDAAANPGKIDLVYLYRGSPSVFSHSLVAPAADPQYLPGVILPAGLANNTKISKAGQLRDAHLNSTQPSSVYIDDIDFQKLDLSTAPNFATRLLAETGVWVETGDGKYRAYIYINSASTASGGSAVISIKRYQMN